MRRLIIFSDGGSRGNPGKGAYGFIIYNEKKETIYKEGKTIGITTNNTAEYIGVYQALAWLIKNNYTLSQIDFYLDSQLVVEQLSNRFKVKNETLKNLYKNIKKLEQKISNHIQYHHIPREKNKAADSLVNQALDA